MVCVEHYWHSQWNSQYIAVKFDTKETADMKWWVITGKNIASFVSKFPSCQEYASIIKDIAGIIEFLLD
jgi:hypothetical protein